MTFRLGLNKKQQILCAKWLKEGVNPESIAKKFKTTEEVVLRFTQEKLDTVKEKQKVRLEQQKKYEAEQKAKAAVLTQALASNVDGPDFV
jgi:hypothetical protein